MSGKDTDKEAKRVERQPIESHSLVIPRLVVPLARSFLVMLSLSRLLSSPLLSSLVTFSPLTLVPSSLHTRRRQERGDRALRDEVTREWRKREAYGLGSLGPTGHSMLPAQPSYRRSFTYSINE